MTSAWRYGPPGRVGLSHYYSRPQTPQLSPATRDRADTACAFGLYVASAATPAAVTTAILASSAVFDCFRLFSIYGTSRIREMPRICVPTANYPPMKKPATRQHRSAFQLQFGGNVPAVAMRALRGVRELRAAGSAPRGVRSCALRGVRELRAAGAEWYGAAAVPRCVFDDGVSSLSLIELSGPNGKEQHGTIENNWVTHFTPTAPTSQTNIASFGMFGSSKKEGQEGRGGAVAEARTRARARARELRCNVADVAGRVEAAVDTQVVADAG